MYLLYLLVKLLKKYGIFKLKAKNSNKLNIIGL